MLLTISVQLCLFSLYSSIQKHISAQLLDGSHVLVTHIGTIHCSSSLVLTIVFHIPSFTFNLLSISQLTRSTNWDVISSFSECIFQDRANKMRIGWGSARNGLLYLDADLDFNSAFSSKHCNKFDLWHAHLGQPYRSHFDFMFKHSPDVVTHKDFVHDVDTPLAYKLQVHML